MKAVAVVVTYGRPELAELLACVDRQTLQLPTVVYVDDAPQLQVSTSNPLVVVVQGPAHKTLGGVRHDAIEAARTIFKLGAESGVLVLDDDDFYSSQHFEVTTRALREAEGGWTGGLAIGVTFDGGPVQYVCNDGGAGQHATWAFRLARYDEAGGYPDVSTDEDLGLGYAMGLRTCAPHWSCTHVRRQSTFTSVSGLRYDREKLRREAMPLARAKPFWSPQCAYLERWCLAHFEPSEPTRPLSRQ